MKHSRNSQQIQGDFQDFEAPALLNRSTPGK